MRKIGICLGLMALCLISIVMVKRIKKPVRKAAYTIGILQTASHPALDACREGFMKELTEKLGTDVDFIVNNAQGSIAQAHAIAQQFQVNKQLNGFFAIATPAAQAMSAVEQARPIFIAAVTDPVSLGLIHATTNVCGVKDMIDVKATVAMLKQLIPEAKTVGLLYASGEVNSIFLAKEMRKALEIKGVGVTDFAVSNEADMQAVVELACRKVDILLAPTDNLVASTISLIAAITLKYKKPFIVSDNMLVTFGALAARGVDYYVSGQQAASIAYEVFVQGKKPYEIPINQSRSEKIFVNKATLQSLGLSIPNSMQQETVLITKKD